MSEIDFKQQINNDLLTRMKKILEDEESHYEFLLNHLVRTDNMVRIFLSNSVAIINHLKVRIAQYSEYIKNN